MKIAVRIKGISIIPFMFLLVCGLFFACNGGGAGEYEFSDWDQDDNGMLDENEFDRAYAATAYYNQWDANEDQGIDENEWGEGVANYWVAYDVADYGGFATWDSDVDGRVSGEEFRQRVLRFYDKDGDQMLNEEEYQNWYNDFNE